MKKNDLPGVVGKEYKVIDFEELAREILKGGHRYSIVIDDDGSIYDFEDMNRDRELRKDGKLIMVIDCPYYPEPVNSRRELRLLTKKLMKMVYDRIVSAPNYYFKQQNV